MPSWRLPLVAVCLATGCTFPTDGVLLQSEPPDAEIPPGDAVIPDAELSVPDAEIPDAEVPDAELPPDACVGVEACNDADDDCDGMIDEDFDLDTDELNCGTCGHVCTNPNGTTECLTTMCTPSCKNGAAECDGSVDNGCELQDTDPICLGVSNTPDLTINGDATSQAITTGTAERLLRVQIAESVFGGGPAVITGRFTLVSGPGTDFDLIVYCPTCGTAGITDADDIIEVGRTDVAGTTTYDVFVEVRYDGATTPSTTCNAWTLTVDGNVATSNRCAN